MRVVAEENLFFNAQNMKKSLDGQDSNFSLTFFERLIPYVKT
jgi:hypothetical protein